MNPTLIKATIGSLSLAGLATGGYYGLQSLNSEELRKNSNVKNILQQQKYTLLNSESANISTVIEKYKTFSDNNLKFKNFDGNPLNNKTASQILLEKCNLIFENRESNNKIIIEKARRWCVEPINISSLLERNNIKSLKTGDNDDIDAWDRKIKSYIDIKNNSKPKIQDLNLTDYSESNKTEKIKSIKSKCKEISAKNNYEDKFDENLEIFKLWCSNI